MRRLFNIFCVTATLAMMSCSKDGIDVVKNPNEEGSPIRFSQTITRGTPLQSGDVVPGISVVAYEAAYQPGQATFLPMQSLVKGANGTWGYAEPQYWPVDGSAVDFLAVSPAATSENGLTLIESVDNYDAGFSVLNKNQYLHLKYVVPGVATLQPDLLFSKTSGSEAANTPNLSFQHALSAVSFSVIGTSLQSVQSITITNLRTTYEVVFCPDAADANNVLTSISAPYPAENSVGAPIDPEVVLDPSEKIMVTPQNGYLMMVPQDIYEAGKSSSTRITVDYTDADGKMKIMRKVFPRAADDSHKWEAGNHYNYTITLLEEVEVIFNVTPWVDGGEGELWEPEVDFPILS